MKRGNYAQMKGGYYEDIYQEISEGKQNPYDICMGHINPSGTYVDTDREEAYKCCLKVCSLTETGYNLKKCEEKCIKGDNIWKSLDPCNFCNDEKCCIANCDPTLYTSCKVHCSHCKKL